MAVRRHTLTKRKSRYRGQVKKRRPRNHRIEPTVDYSAKSFSLTPLQLQQLHEYIRHIRLEIDKYRQSNHVENLKHLRTIVSKMEQFVRSVDASPEKLTPLIILFEPTLHTLNQNPIPIHLLVVQLQSMLQALFVFITSPTFIHNQIIVDIQELISLLLRIHVRLEVLAHDRHAVDMTAQIASITAPPLIADTEGSDPLAEAMAIDHPELPLDDIDVNYD